jgi:hypothetical protein
MLQAGRLMIPIFVCDRELKLEVGMKVTMNTLVAAWSLFVLVGCHRPLQADEHARIGGEAAAVPVLPGFRDEPVPVDKLELNRVARPLSSKQIKKFPFAHTGFIWNRDDNLTRAWRPQGITGFNVAERKFLAVSWYGRKPVNYAKLGVRISFVDITDMTDISYRHVLLVDKKLATFKGMHAGGLAYLGGKLHVPDSRSVRKVHVFSLASIFDVPKADKRFYNYAYILPNESTYAVSIKPSFISIDRDSDRILIGTFDRKNPQPLTWESLTSGKVIPDRPFPFYKEMQGAVSMNERLWISCSFGRVKKSTLHYGKYLPGEVPDLEPFERQRYPAGLEDLYLSEDSQDLWMLTEFGPLCSPFSNRTVFAVKRDELMP